MTEHDDTTTLSYITYKNDDDDLYHISFFNKDGIVKKNKSFSTVDELEQYTRYLDLKDKYKEDDITDDEFKEYELYLRCHFIIKHYDQFSKLKPYGRHKIITKMYNAKYHFNISDNTFKPYLSYNFNL